MCNKVDNHCREEKLGCEGCKYNKEIDFLENAAGEMEKRIWIDDFHFITLQELKAINKKVEELGWE